MRRAALITFSLVAYLGFVAVIVWATAFLADLPLLTRIDDDGHHAVTFGAVGVDVALLAAFAAHHSVLARDAAKRQLARVLPAEAVRATYVFGADVLLALVLWQWHPLTATVWHLDGEPWRTFVWVATGGGWLIAIASTFMIDHFDLLGVRQAATVPGRYAPPAFRIRWLYRWVRHPLMLGLLMAFWITPAMTVGHLLFAVAATAYIAVGVRLEERDLRRVIGPRYLVYAERVPAIAPWPLGRLRKKMGIRPDAPAPRERVASPHVVDTQSTPERRATWLTRS
jgi:protein-S-isoprenylcysteine O-methyltransferase Ste14